MRCDYSLYLKQISREVGQEFGTIFSNQDHIFDSHVSFIREEHLRLAAEDHARLSDEFRTRDQERYFMNF